MHHGASERSALRLEHPVEEERTPLRKPKVHVINVSPAPLSEPSESVSSQPENIMDEEDAEPVDQQPVAVRRPTLPVAKTRRETSEPVDTADVSRLMAETDQQMAKPESNRRRNALAHLRAAVAATIADKSLGKDDKDSTEAYRDDLAKAVRPRRPDPSDMRKSAPPLDWSQNSASTNLMKSLTRLQTPLPKQPKAKTHQTHPRKTNRRTPKSSLISENLQHMSVRIHLRPSWKQPQRIYRKCAA